MRPWELVEHESIKRNTLYTLGIFTDQLILVCSPNLHSCSTLCLLLLQHLFCPFAHTSLSTCLCVCDFDICVELWSLLTRLPRCGVCDFWWVCDCVSWVQLRLCYVWICHMSTNLIGLLQSVNLFVWAISISSERRENVRTSWCTTHLCTSVDIFLYLTLKQNKYIVIKFMNLQVWYLIYQQDKSRKLSF